MAKRNSGSVLPAVIILIVVLGLGVLFISHRKNLMNADNQIPTYSPIASPQAAAGDSNSDLNTDMDTINASLNTVNNSNIDVNSGINDTPIAQPNY